MGALMKLTPSSSSATINIMELRKDGQYDVLPFAVKDFLSCSDWKLHRVGDKDILTVNYCPRDDQCILVPRTLSSDEAKWFLAALKLKSPLQHRLLTVSAVPETAGVDHSSWCSGAYAVAVERL